MTELEKIKKQYNFLCDEIRKEESNISEKEKSIEYSKNRKKSLEEMASKVKAKLDSFDVTLDIEIKEGDIFIRRYADDTDCGKAAVFEMIIVDDYEDDVYGLCGNKYIFKSPYFDFRFKNGCHGEYIATISRVHSIDCNTFKAGYLKVNNLNLKEIFLNAFAKLDYNLLHDESTAEVLKSAEEIYNNKKGDNNE